MNLSGLSPLLEETPDFQALVARLEQPAPFAHSVGVVESARGFVIAALQKVFAGAAGSARPLVIVTPRADRAKQLLVDLQAWSAEPEEVLLFAEPDPLLYERSPWGIETIVLRLAALSALSDPRWINSGIANPRRSAPVIVTTIRALMPLTAPPEVFKASVFTLERGDSIAPTDLMRRWVELGYEASAVVEAPGLFSRRGGIIDIWLPSQPSPTRIEFIGDEVESLRRFDPSSQRSGETIDSLVITPASEVQLSNSPNVSQIVRRWDLSSLHPIAATTFRQDFDALERRERFRGIEFYLPYFYHRPASLIDYLPSNGLIVVDDWQELEAVALQFEQQAEQVRQDLEIRAEIPYNLARPYMTWELIRAELLKFPRLLFDYRGVEEVPTLPFASGPRYGGQLRKVIDELMRFRAEKSRVVVVSRQSERLSDLMRERGVYIKPAESVEHQPKPGHVELIQGALAEGWKLTIHNESIDEIGKDATNYATDLKFPTPILIVLTDAEIFGWARPKPRRIASQYARTQAPETFFADLAVGDYVVHIDHGIGSFRGLQKLDLGGPETEYLVVEYAQGDRLYVPVHQLDRLSRYVAPGGHTPPLHRLGTADWSQVKERTKKAVADIAKELLELYAKREVVGGHAYSADTPWQHELEASFPYVETSDQLSVIEEVKQDMQRDRPMDRLVVGDVGYGKTEVALRAAFKAVMDGKQVAILVPTTVLAQQHYNTFRERLAPFPVSVEMLSRFRSEKEQGEIVRRLTEGGVDIVIGTHRLLSKDVQFKDLGLMIVDEEQRFGVTHKERLKQLREQVDVLTLTATPIPRTLYLSLSGARDMSTIETPPEERLPIRTFVAAYDERLARDAILRELDRGGQVFFVHNRVRGIGILTEQLRKLVPEARIGIGHGQMPEEQLEAVMSEFASGAYDVLVCTTIIESGIDIPNANTIIINNADKFGLAQLYQLRGRVGRSSARAYAYFLYDKRANLSEEARSRLQSIAEATELGAGFQLAMRDLEIRGAGEILGARQSGHIAAVGFDLYCRLLAGAIQDARREEQSDGSNGKNGSSVSQRLLNAPTLDLPVVSQIPSDYVADSSLRLRLYRRLADVATGSQVDELEREFEERFGPLPESVQNLFYLLRLKLAAVQADVATIAPDDGRLMVKFRHEDSTRMQELTSRFGNRLRSSRDRAWLPGPETDEHWRERLMQVIVSAGNEKAESVPR